jgi:hypothetical protein
MSLYAWSEEGHASIEDAINCGALYTIFDLVTVESNNIKRLSSNTEVLDAVDVFYNTAKFLGTYTKIHLAIGDNTEIFYVFNGSDRTWKYPTIKIT